VNLTIGVDFENQVFRSSILHYMEVLQDNVTYVVFDIQGVVVTSVRIGYNDYTDFHILTPNKNLGDELFFYLPTTYNKGDQLAVTIEYYTTEDQLATSWL
jgi:hypothetical protein